MVKICLNVSKFEGGKLRFSKTAVRLHCLRPKKMIENPQPQRILSRMHADGLRAQPRAPPHGRKALTVLAVWGVPCVITHVGKF